MSLLKGLLVLVLSVVLIGVGAFAFVQWVSGEDPVFGLDERCAAFVDGYVARAEPVAGPPPDGWVEGTVQYCVESEGVFKWRTNLGMVDVSLVETNDYCAAWELGSSMAGISGINKAEPTPCPLHDSPEAGE